MKFSQKVRRIWHEAFYKNASEEKVELALTCQDVTATIDLHEKPTAISGQLRFWLHLSLCQACKNYYDLSKVLSKAVKARPSSSGASFEQLNQNLLEKFSQKDNSKKSK